MFAMSGDMTPNMVSCPYREESNLVFFALETYMTKAPVCHRWGQVSGADRGADWWSHARCADRGPGCIAVSEGPQAAARSGSSLWRRGPAPGFPRGTPPAWPGSDHHTEHIWLRCSKPDLITVSPSHVVLGYMSRQGLKLPTNLLRSPVMPCRKLEKG